MVVLRITTHNYPDADFEHHFLGWTVLEQELTTDATVALLFLCSHCLKYEQVRSQSSVPICCVLSKVITHRLIWGSFAVSQDLHILYILLHNKAAGNFPCMCRVHIDCVLVCVCVCVQEHTWAYPSPVAGCSWAVGWSVAGGTLWWSWASWLGSGTWWELQTHSFSNFSLLDRNIRVL